MDLEGHSVSYSVIARGGIRGKTTCASPDQKTNKQKDGEGRAREMGDGRKGSEKRREERKEKIRQTYLRHWAIQLNIHQQPGHHLLDES